MLNKATEDQKKDYTLHEDNLQENSMLREAVQILKL